MRRLAVALILAAGVVWADEWVRLESEHFELYTNAGERAGRQALDKFEQIRQVFQEAGAGSKQSPMPVRVYLFRSARDFRPHKRGEATLGFYQGGAERNYIAMQAAGEETYRVVFHEYVHLVLNHTSPRLPQWLEEGIADLYSTLEADGERLRIGKPVARHVETLRQKKWLEAERLAVVNHSSPEYNERNRASVFYAQSWALAHMLNLTRGYRDRFARFVQLLREGSPQGAALEEAFGKSMAEAMQDLRAYVAARRFPTAEVAWEAREPGKVEMEAISAAQAQLALVELLLAQGLADTAEKRLRKLERTLPRSAETETAWGLVEMSRRRFARARKRLEQAIRYGSRQASTYFEYAMLLRETGGERGQVREHLEKTVQLNPFHAEAHFLLGLLAANEGRHRDAVGPLQRATEILPRQAYFWHALALACHHAGDREQARKAAFRTLQAATTQEEADMARAAIRLVETKPGKAEQDRPDVVTPQSWTGKQGDRKVEGILERIDCLGRTARLHLRVGAARIALYVADPEQIRLGNAPNLTFDFTCGAQPPRVVVVEYTARKDAAQETDGDVVTIEFR